MLESDDACRDIDEKIMKLFSYTINIKPPGDESSLMSWKSQLEEDTKTIQSQDNKNHITEVLAANDLECYDLDSICQADSKVLNDHIQEIVVSTLTFHLMNNKEPEYKNGKLLTSSKRRELTHNLYYLLWQLEALNTVGTTRYALTSTAPKPGHLLA
ncbi:hypothetical protein AgCh_009802 [Apium graveolens]